MFISLLSSEPFDDTTSSTYHSILDSNCSSENLFLDSDLTPPFFLDENSIDFDLNPEEKDSEKLTKIPCCLDQRQEIKAAPQANFVSNSEVLENRNKPETGKSIRFLSVKIEKKSKKNGNKAKDIHNLICYFKTEYNTFIVDKINKKIKENDCKFNKQKLKCYKIKYDEMTNVTTYYMNQVWLKSKLSEVLQYKNPKNSEFIKKLSQRKEQDFVCLFKTINELTYAEFLGTFYASDYLKSFKSKERISRLDASFREKKGFSLLEEGGFQRFFDENLDVL